MTEHPVQKYNQRKCPRCGEILERIDTICAHCGKLTPVKNTNKSHRLVRHFDT